MGKSDPLFHFRLTPLLLGLLDARSDEARALLARAGLPESAADGPVTAPLSAVRALLAAAARASGEDVGLRLAARIPAGTYDIAELLVRTAPTLEVGLAALCRAAPLINPVGRFEAVSRGARRELHYHVAGLGGGLGPHLSEMTLAYLLAAVRAVAGDPPLAPIEAWLPGPRRRGAPDVAAALACPVRHGAGTLGFALDRAAAARAPRTADPVVFAYLARQAEERLQLLGDRSFAAVVTEVIETGVGMSEAELSRVARHLRTTERTVQRRLEEEGTSFREVLDQLRRRHAERLMGDRLPAARVAEVLGFAEVRSFRRALKRWGRAPTG